MSRGKLIATVLGALLTLFSTIASTEENVQSLNGKTILWAGCGITKKAFMAELAAAYEAKTGVHIELQGGGATKGIRAAAQRTVQIGGACRATIEDHEIESKVKQVPVAWDALAIIVNRNNPVSEINLHQLRQIYLGKITNWKDLGGNDAPIKLYVRQGKISGVGRALRALVFANYEQNFTSRATVVRSSGPAEKAVETDVNAMTTTGVSSAKRRDVKVLRLQGIEPTYDNIKEGKYLLYRPLYLVIPKVDPDPIAVDFIEFALSREGKAVIRKAGTVPYTDAMGLVFKQIEQMDRANKAGL
jgi:phosphate transport system substrate-binding protein